MCFTASDVPTHFHISDMLSSDVHSRAVNSYFHSRNHGISVKYTNM